MDASYIFYLIFSFLNIIILFSALYAILQFYLLDKDQFKNYILGLVFYSIGIFGFYLRYIVMSPLSDVETFALVNLTHFPALFGIVFFVKGTKILAYQEKADSKTGHRLYTIILYFFVFDLLFLIVHGPFIFISEDLFWKLNSLSLLFLFMIVILSLINLFQFQKIFMPPINKVIYLYILSIVLIISGALIITAALRPVSTAQLTIADISVVRNTIAVAGFLTAFVPFLIFIRSIRSFRKSLSK